MKIILTLILLSSSSIVFAQIEKGRSFLSGSISYSSSGAKSDNASPEAAHNFFIGVMYGYMLSDRWAIGVTPAFEGNKPIGSGSTRYRAFSAGPFARRYFSINDKFFFHLDGGINTGFRQQWTETQGVKSPLVRDRILDFYVAPGASFFITDKIALTANVGRISYTDYKRKGDNNQSWNFDSNFGLNSLTMGATIYF